ncbi:MAG: protein translocase subunit SecD, partial [Pseudomonadota bacterium]
MTPYPRWKYAVFAVLVMFGFIYALPNWYGDDPAVQVSGALEPQQSESLLALLAEHQLKPKSARIEEDAWVVRFARTQDQLKAKDILEPALPSQCTAALYLAPATPKWLQVIGATPMKLGLDLRGGVHFLLDVDLQAALTQRLTFTLNEVKTTLKEHKIHFDTLTLMEGHSLALGLAESNREKAFEILKGQFRDYEWRITDDQKLMATMVPRVVQEIQNYTLEQTMGTLRNRVNELGVAEAVVHRQGVSHIVVELPGIQEPARAKDLLGKTATLSFHLREETQDISAALQGRPV